ncbi:type II toxin-antitoxin system HigB family toxin [Aerosakkonema sp. BLCC-F183]
MITFIDYDEQIVFIRSVLTHAEYDNKTWKNYDWFKNS